MADESLKNLNDNEEKKETVSKNFIEREIDKDLSEGVYDCVHTRFPPEPNGYLHVGHAKSILLNYGLAKEYGGKFNLRFDDTNPTKEKTEYVNAIIEDVKWLGADFEDRLFFASDYCDEMYEKAVLLIKKGKAYVSDLSADEIKAYRGDFNTPGKEDPARKRSIEENLQLFTDMKDGKYADGEKVLRAKIDMAAGNINMRDPVIYRIARLSHHNTGDKWCIYPMYDFAHPIEDAIEGITHSICTLEFEDHRPLYDWVVKECEYPHPPRQIEFAKMYLTNVVTGKRYIKKLVDDGIVDGWDDPRLVTIAALRRRGYTPESIAKFVKLAGISKADSSCDMDMLEYCVRDDLKLKKARIMAVLHPLKLVIDQLAHIAVVAQKCSGVGKHELLIHHPVFRHGIVEHIQHPHAVVFHHHPLGLCLSQPFLQVLPGQVLLVLHHTDLHSVGGELLRGVFLLTLLADKQQSFLPIAEAPVLQSLLDKLGLAALKKAGEKVYGDVFWFITQY